VLKPVLMLIADELADSASAMLTPTVAVITTVVLFRPLT
jgi:hypothetical protein